MFILIYILPRGLLHLSILYVQLPLHLAGESPASDFFSPEFLPLPRSPAYPLLPGHSTFIKPFRSWLRQVRNFIQYTKRLSQPLAVSTLNFCPVHCFSVMEHLLTVVMLVTTICIQASACHHLHPWCHLLPRGIWLASGVSVLRLPVWKLTFDCCNA